MQLPLFDYAILPVVKYGCEIMGFEHNQVLKNLNAFLRQNVGLRTSKHYICYMQNRDDNQYTLISRHRG